MLLCDITVQFKTCRLHHKMDLVEYPLKLLNFCGQSLIESQNRIIFNTIHACLMILWLVLSILKPIICHEGFSGWMNTFEIVGPFIQWSSKLMVLKYHKRAIQQLLKDFDEFWPLDMFDKKTERTLRQIRGNITKMLKIYNLSGFATICTMNLKSLFTIGSTWEFPVAIYYILDFTKMPYYILAYLSYIGHCYTTLFIIIGFDSLFVTLLISATHQLRLLKVGLKSLNFNTRADASISYNRLKKYIKHHSFILAYIKKMKEIYSFYLVNQFLLSVISICSPIYLFYTTGVTDVVTIFRYFCYSLACSLQILTYCITGHQVKTEIVSVADAIYETDWWKSDIRAIRQACLLIIQRSNNVSTLKAGGMVDLDMQSFVKVLRMSFSFFTLIQSTEAKKP